MPILIIHGEHLVHSRQKLAEVIDQAKKAGREVARLPAANLTPAILERALGETTLFGVPKTLIIEELHSLQTSANKKSVIENLSQATLDPELLEIVLWEKRSLTKTMIGKFPQARATEFKISKSIFTWLDSLTGQKTSQKRQVELFHQAVTEEDEWYCFIMLARQVRLLIQIQAGSPKGVAPFMVGKLKQQAGSFTPTQLLQLHQRLLELDLKHKTSTNNLSLVQDLDLLLLQL